jgi:hypothetical protein
VLSLRGRFGGSGGGCGFGGGLGERSLDRRRHKLWPTADSEAKCEEKKAPSSGQGRNERNGGKRKGRHSSSNPIRKKWKLDLLAVGGEIQGEEEGEGGEGQGGGGGRKEIVTLNDLFYFFLEKSHHIGLTEDLTRVPSFLKKAKAHPFPPPR